MYTTLQSRSHRHALRACALGMFLLQAVATGPFLWAAPALLDPSFRVAPLSAPAAKGPAPDAALVARQAGLITGQSAG